MNTELQKNSVNQGVRIEIVTIAYMTLEAILSIVAGLMAHSALLAAFGIDSILELISGIILLWRLRVGSNNQDMECVEKAENRAAWGTVMILALLCLYILVSSIYGLASQTQAETSILGIGVTLAAVILMPYLAIRKKQIARSLDSLALADDATASITCAYMAGTVLFGLVLNLAFHWWWAEDVAGLIFFIWLGKETWEAIREIREG